jgi:prefoldin beta subunit
MSQNQQIPPMLQEQLSKLQQTQQNLQMIIAQKQQLELEQLETEKALVELNKANDDDAVFKQYRNFVITEYFCFCWVLRIEFVIYID